MSTGTYYTCDMCGRIEMKGNASGAGSTAVCGLTITTGSTSALSAA